MSDQPKIELSKDVSEPTSGTDQTEGAAEAGTGNETTFTREQMQEIFESAARQGGPYAMLPAFNLGVQPSIPAAFLPMMQIQAKVWQGQLPPPEAMEHYEKILPGSFDRILKMAEKQQNGQIENINLAQSYVSRDIRRGHYLGFSLSALAMFAAWAFVYEHQPYIAALCLGVPVLSVARAFIDGAQSKQKNPETTSAPGTTHQSAK